jgi:nucleoside-diphosphate-sugar epimerase
LYSGDNLNPITEKLPVDPPSKKGKIRAVLVESFWRAVKEEGLQGCIARCADFYGPGKSQNDVLGQAVFAPLSKGQTANWTGGLDYKHAFTYTPDAGKATALLGNSPEAYGQAWHLPTAPNPYTGRELVEKIAAEFGVKAKMRGMNRSMATILGLFIPLLREVKEMMYQYEQDYIFSSDKFEAQFDMKPTPYDEGIQTIIKQDYS